MRINTRKKFEKEIDFFSDEFQQEQKRLETYIKQRPLPRPKTTKSVVITWVLIYLLVAFLLAATVIIFSK